MVTEPFRGSAAVAAGLVTARQLRGPRFRRLFHDVYVPAALEVDPAVRARAAHVSLAGRGVLAGWSAAELLGASCGPWDGPAEVITDVHRRRQTGLVVHRDRVAPDEVVEVGGIALTGPARTAYDLLRWNALVEGVVAVDALARVCGFDPAVLRGLHHRHLGAPGSRRLTEALRLADPRSGSPMETRIRLAIVGAGLPTPRLQFPVGPYLLDLAYPAAGLGIEYDGREHRTAERALRDLDRQAYLTAAGWTKILRFRAAQVYRPGLVAGEVRHELICFGRRHGRTLADVLALLAADR